VDAYGRAAVELLQQAIARGYTNFQDLKTKAVFAPLRQRADFRRITEELEKSKPGIA
jgi:hypothetical protein